jgi:hypothetical protein
MLFGNLRQLGVEVTPMFKLFMLSVLALLLSWSAVLTAQQPASRSRWVPYIAQYTESVSVRSSSGNTTQNQTFSEETRSSDGAVLTVVKVGGQPSSGKLWEASGQRFSLDYLSRTVVSTGNSPRQHPFIPPDAPLGSKTIAGIQCTLYPIYTKAGTGTICVDINNDIMVSAETHTDIAGMHQDYVKQLTTIDLTTPIDNSRLQVPAGFTKVVPSESK